MGERAAAACSGVSLTHHLLLLVVLAAVICFVCLTVSSCDISLTLAMPLGKERERERAYNVMR